MAGSKAIRVFTDTNVILSGLHSSQGPPGIILERFVRGDIELVISRQVLDETIRVVRDKLPRVLPAFKIFLEHNPPEICPDAGPEQAAGLTDALPPGDAAILAAACAAKPNYFVTGDRHFLSNAALMRKTKMRIVSPATLLEALER